MESLRHELNRKVAIIGAGYVGASIANNICLLGLANEIVLIDANADKAHGEAMDIRHGIPFMNTAHVYAGCYSDCVGCDLIIITAGRNRRPTETRLNLAADNAVIMRGVVGQLERFYTGSVIMLVSNPVDILTYCCEKWMGTPSGTVFGTGCLLDTSRFVRQVSDYLDLDADAISALVVGEHGNCQFPLWSRVSVTGIAVSEYCRVMGIPWGETQRQNIVKNTHDMGTRIIAAKDRTHYGIAACVCYLAGAILNNRTTIVPVGSVMQGEYGISDVALSVPSLVNSKGIFRRIEESWEPEELQNLRRASETLKEVLRQIM